MDKKKGLKGFLVMLPGKIIEIPQDSDKSWLTLFYSLPRELAEKWKPAYELPRCPYAVLRTDKYDHIVCDDMFKLLVWDCYAWCAWQFFQVKDRKGNYRDIPGNWNQYAGYFLLWWLCEYVIHVVLIPVFFLQSTHLCNMKQNRYQNAAFGCFGLMPLYAPIFLPRRQ